MSFHPPHRDPAFPAHERKRAEAVHLGTLLVAVLSAGLLGIVVPLVARLALRHPSAALRAHLRQQLALQTAFLGVVAVLAFLTIATAMGLGALITVPLLLVAYAANLVCCAAAAAAAAHGESEAFPFFTNLAATEPHIYT
jgi:uncharacterized Tic20 family protein